jgi:hypothetical protein
LQYKRSDPDASDAGVAPSISRGELTVFVTLKQHMTFAIEHTRELFIQQGHVNAMVHAIDGQGEHIFIMLPMADDNQKDFAAAALRRFIMDKNIIQLVYIAEAWVVSLKNPDMTNLPRPKDHPERTEALVFQGENATQNLTAQVEIRRHGNKVELGPTDMWEEPSIQAGRFTDLLGNKRTRH